MIILTLCGALWEDDMEWSIRSERYFAKKKAALEKKAAHVPRRMRGKPRLPEDIRRAQDALNAVDYVIRAKGRPIGPHYRRRNFK